MEKLKVVVRIRPFLQNESDANTGLNIDSENSQRIEISKSLKNQKKKRTNHLQVVHHLKMKEKRRKNQRKSQNLKNQNVLVAKKNYHSSGVDMVIDMDSEDTKENVQKKMLKN